MDSIIGTVTEYTYDRMRIIINDWGTKKTERVQWYFPSTKKKRIQKKAKKNPENYMNKTSHFMIKMGNDLIMSEKMFDKLKENFTYNPITEDAPRSQDQKEVL